MADTGANRSAIDLETAKTLARLRKIGQEFGPSEAARRTGISESTASRVLNGKRYKKSYTALDQLGLKFSKRLCRRCGKESGIICNSLLCVRCELLELHKEGVIMIQAEEGCP